MKSISYIHIVVFLTISSELIIKCQCLSSATTTQKSEEINTEKERIQARFLGNGVETITSLQNLLSGDPQNTLISDDISNNDYSYFSSPVVLTTPEYESNPIAHYYSDQQSDIINHTYFPPLLKQQTSYAPPKPFKYIVPLAKPPHYVKIMNDDQPFWEQDLVKLENQYMDTFRNIKSSVMGFFYKMQDFVSFVFKMFTGKCYMHICNIIIYSLNQ